MIKIRKSTSKDHEEILQLIKQLANSMNALEAVKISSVQLKKDESLFNCLVAESPEGEIVGIATYFYAYFSWTGKSIYLDDLVVKESWRGKGIGTTLFDQIIQLAQESDCTRVRWEVSRHNHNAIEFYEKKQAHIERDIMVCQINF